MARKAMFIAAAAAVIFGILMLVLGYYQQKTEAECIGFLLESGFSEEQLHAYDHLLGKGLSEEWARTLDPETAAAAAVLLQRHRAYAYWAAVSRGVAEVALLVLAVLGLRALFKRITVPARLHRKLWPDQD